MQRLSLAEVKQLTHIQKKEYQRQLNADRQRRYKEANPDKVKNNNKESVYKYRTNNPEKFVAQNRKNSSKAYYKKKIVHIIDELITSAVQQSENKRKK